MEFKYGKKETYTQEDLDNILSQHTGYVEKGFKDFVSAEDFNKVVEELKPFKEAEQNKKITGLMPENANQGAINDIIAIANIQPEDDENAIKEKLSKTIADRPHFQTAETVDPDVAKTKVMGNPDPKPENVKTSDDDRNMDDY